jgi:hypothetical protein
MEDKSKRKDFEWYIKKGIPLDIGHFLKRAKDTGDWTKKTITKEQIKDLLSEKFNTVSFDTVKDDVVRFIKDDKALKIWSPNYFNDLLVKMKME